MKISESAFQRMRNVIFSNKYETFDKIVKVYPAISLELVEGSYLLDYSAASVLQTS